LRFLAWIQFFQFLIYLGRSDYYHWLNASFLLAPITALVFEECLDWIDQAGLCGFTNRTSAVFCSTVVSFPLLLVMIGRDPQIPFPNGFHLRTLWPRMITNGALPQRWGAIPANEATVAQVHQIVTGIQSLVPPGGNFFDFSDYGVFYFLSGRRNPTRFGVVEIIQGPRERAQCLEALSKNPPQVVLARTGARGLDCHAELGAIRDFIEQRYRPWKKIGPFELMVLSTGKLRA